jgi:MoaA/NifB/PqqE/SkfB family radical SAM enzyme
MIARRERPLGRAVSPMRARANAQLRDRDFTEGRAVVSSRPSRFFFSVTERCNLRCAHCITHAPERTKSGLARTMTAAVLDGIRDDLALGSYFAFVHGGESLTAPILYDVLEAIQQARGTEPYAAHLLTNGVMLSVDTADRLVTRGVSSISVSLDGATRETNDAIREGGRFDDVCRAVRDVAAWRRARGKDLRLGLSYVVLAQNVGELDAFVDLGARLGVDWIKLEEGVPATAFAKRSLVSCASPETRAAIDGAVRRGREAGIVMVDHTFDRVIWRCRMDDETRAFLGADELANRGPIHPCRTPWETACIEPNGDVRAVDFYGPVLGNVTRAPLAELWNGPEARDARERSQRARLCGAGPVVCLP